MDTVLIVDDDPGVLLLIRNILAHEDYRLETASDGESARLLLEQKPEDYLAVLLDWQMPEMDGIELLRSIKSHPALEHIPVIMQTAMDSPEQIRQGIDAGAFYYLTKPFDKIVLHSIVKAAVTDARDTRSLLKKLKESENPFATLLEGKFRFRTLAEAERMALWIAHACPSPERAMQISEILINAVEHGNLGITYEEKGEFVARGTWRQEIERRLGLPANAEKYIDLDVKRHGSTVTVLVEDQGAGFDYSSYLEFNEDRAFDIHGRGIAIARAYLGLEYQGNGNRVLVTIVDDGSDHHGR
jgi:DNA-binding response OmpR family regulator